MQAHHHTAAELSVAAKLAMRREQPEASTVSGKLTLLCGLCLEPFERLPRSEQEIEKIRRALLICSKSRPAVCDSCLNLHGYWMHKAQGPNGQTFHDTPNFMLRYQARFPHGEPR